MELDFLYIKNNVGYLTKKQREFSNLYTAVRKTEKRMLTDHEVLQLPKILTTNRNAKEWELRKKSTERFTDYLKTKIEALTILDIGCGNGWFSNKMAAANNKNKIIGVDINNPELKQAARLFKTKNIQFVYADIFKTNAFHSKFNIITLNACVQYFQDFELLMSTLKGFLKPDGEIHIIDSPFYRPSQIYQAKKRTLAYYTALGFPEMASHYFHHKKENIQDFEVMYKKKNKILTKVLKVKDSPFPWLRYANTN